MGRRQIRHPDSAAGGSTRQKDEILKTIVDKMISGQWLPYRSVRELALSHDMEMANAEKYVCEASRLIRLSWGGEEAKAAIIERIAQIGRAAEFRTEEAIKMDGEIVSVRKPDHRTALRAAETLASIVGLTGPTADVIIRLQQMSDGELWAEAERFGRDLTTHGVKRHVETTGQAAQIASSSGGHDDPANDLSGSETESDLLDRLVPEPSPRR